MERHKIVYEIIIKSAKNNGSMPEYSVILETLSWDRKELDDVLDTPPSIRGIFELDKETNERVAKEIDEEFKSDETDTLTLPYVIARIFLEEARNQLS